MVRLTSVSLSITGTGASQGTLKGYGRGETVNPIHIYEMALRQRCDRGESSRKGYTVSYLMTCFLWIDCSLWWRDEFARDCCLLASALWLLVIRQSE